jgi:hypothetical protein
MEQQYLPLFLVLITHQQQVERQSFTETVQVVLAM